MRFQIRNYGHQRLLLRQSLTPLLKGSEDEKESQDCDPAPEVKNSDVTYGAAATSNEFDLVSNQKLSL